MPLPPEDTVVFTSHQGGLKKRGFRTPLGGEKRQGTEGEKSMGRKRSYIRSWDIFYCWKLDFLL
jgi:hypothetical protein